MSTLKELPPLEPIEFVVDGFIQNGITTIAGWTGVGKTTMLVPVAAAVAHLYQSELPVELRRRVVYVTEDPEQVKAARRAICKHAPGARPWLEFTEWFRVIQAQRLAPKVLAEAIAKLIEMHTVVHPSGYSVRPTEPAQGRSARLEGGYTCLKADPYGRDQL